MPSSRPEMMLPVINSLRKANPATVLDVGCGNGKFGFLIREYLQLWTGENGKPTRFKRVDAIEAWEPYIGELQRLIYDNIIIGDIRKVCENGLQNYDAIIMVEVIEHMSDVEGYRVIEALKAKSKCLIVTTPLEPLEQGAECGNDYEIHESKWTSKMFNQLECSELWANNGHLVAIWY